MRRALMPVILLSACTPSPGVFCHDQACWDVDIPGKTMTIVFPNGQRAPGSIALKPGGDGYDYSIDALGGARTEIKVIDRNTIGIRNSGNTSKDFNRFVRRHAR